MQTLAEFLKKSRREAKITQEELAWKSGVGLRFIRDLEQGKSTLRMDKVNQVLAMFGHQLGPQRIERGAASGRSDDKGISSWKE